MNVDVTVKSCFNTMSISILDYEWVTKKCILVLKLSFFIPSKVINVLLFK